MSGTDVDLRPAAVWTTGSRGPAVLRRQLLLLMHRKLLPLCLQQLLLPLCLQQQLQLLTTLPRRRRSHHRLQLPKLPRLLQKRPAQLMLKKSPRLLQHPQLLLLRRLHLQASFLIT